MRPSLSREQIRELDRRAIEEYGVPGIVLMENAGRGVVDTLRALKARGPFLIACGKGNNAGDGFVIARHLDLLGHAVQIALWADPEELEGDAACNYQIAVRSGLPIAAGAERAEAVVAEAATEAGWILDALLGTGIRGAPRPPLDGAIEQLNAAQRPLLAVDLPSGLDADTGRAAGTVIRADHTCTFVAAKPGLLQRAAEEWVGQLHVVDIGAPRVLVQQMLDEAARQSDD